MTSIEQLLTVGIAAIGTQLTRWLPFVLFRDAVNTPKYVQYLGKVLPPAIFGMLVVYCFREVDFIRAPQHGVPEIISGLCVAISQFAFKNMCVSIVFGTLVYIIWMNV